MSVLETKKAAAKPQFASLENWIEEVGAAEAAATAASVDGRQLYFSISFRNSNGFSEAKGASELRRTAVISMVDSIRTKHSPCATSP